MAQKCQKCFFPSTYPTAAWAAVQCYGTLSPFFYFFIPPPPPPLVGSTVRYLSGGRLLPLGQPRGSIGRPGPHSSPPLRGAAPPPRGCVGAGGRRSGPLFVVVGGALPAVRAGGKRGSNALGAEAPRACASPSPPSRGSGRLLVGLVPPFAPPVPPCRPSEAACEGRRGRAGVCGAVSVREGRAPPGLPRSGLPVTREVLPSPSR